MSIIDCDELIASLSLPPFLPSPYSLSHSLVHTLPLSLRIGRNLKEEEKKEKNLCNVLSMILEFGNYRV